MAIPTSRTKDKAEIKIDSHKCTGCGLCVSVCKDFSIVMQNSTVVKSDHPLFGCIGCGHCMAICPSGAIKIVGRTLSSDDLFDLPGAAKAPSYEQLLALLQRRRSIREFKETTVEEDKIEKILAAAQTAPMGLPPSDVNVLVLKSKKQVRAFAVDFCDYLHSIKWLVSDWFLFLMRPFWGKANDELFRTFVKPLMHTYIENMRKEVNLVTYDAPLAMYFYASPFADPADPIVAATCAMIAGESLGLGTCMIGGIHPLIQNGKKAKRFRKDQGIKFASREGLFVIFGYPSVKYKKGVRRTFASIEKRT
jgi:ferredoxin